MLLFFCYIYLILCKLYDIMDVCFTQLFKMLINRKKGEIRMKQGVKEQETFDLSEFGRHSVIIQWLREYFSEYALVKNKIRIYLFWTKYCLENLDPAEMPKGIDEKKIEKIDGIYEQFSYESYTKIKKAEKRRRNQLQAIEQYVEAELKQAELKNVMGLVYMNCSIDNINDIAYALMMVSLLRETWVPAAERIITAITEMKLQEAVYMISREEDKFNSVEDEMLVYAYRLNRVVQRVSSINIGPLSETALDQESPLLSKKFINECLGLKLNNVFNSKFITYDYMVELADAIRQFNNILLQFNKDMASIERFGNTGELKFESSEDDIQVANIFLLSQSNSVPTSKRIKELEDFHSQKKMVLAFGHSLQAIEKTIAQIDKITSDGDIIQVID